MLSNSVEISTKKRVPAHSAGPARDVRIPSAFPPKSLPPGHVLLEKNRVFQPLASLGLSLASLWPPFASPWPPFGLPWPLLGLPLAPLGLSLASLWPPLAAKGSQMDLPGERKGTKMVPKTPQDIPDTSQDVQWIENGA